MARRQEYDVELPDDSYVVHSNVAIQPPVKQEIEEIAPKKPDREVLPDGEFSELKTLGDFSELKELGDFADIAELDKSDRAEFEEQLRALDQKLEDMGFEASELPIEVLAGGVTEDDVVDLINSREPLDDQINEAVDEYTPSGEPPENDHSFHYRGDTFMSVGGYRVGDGNNVQIPPTVSLDYIVISDRTEHAYWVEVDWGASTGTNVAPVVTWRDGPWVSPTQFFPSGTPDMWIYPVLSFDADENCKEYLQSNIQLPDVRIPAPSGSYGGALVYDPSAANPDDNIKWVYSENDYTYLGRKTDDSMDFDVPRYNAGTP